MDKLRVQRMPSKDREIYFIYLPLKVRERLGLDKGTVLEYRIHNESIILSKCEEQPEPETEDRREPIPTTSAFYDSFL